VTRHPVERLWRQCELPEYFLGNDGTNHKLYALYDAIRAEALADVEAGRRAKAQLIARYVLRGKR